MANIDVDPGQVANSVYSPHLTPLTYERMSFEGEFDALTDEVITMIRDGRRLNFWAPGRLLRGVLDYKIDARPTDPVIDVPELIEHTTALVSDIYGRNVSEEDLAAYTYRIAEYPGLSETIVLHEDDSTSVDASCVRFSRSAAEALADYTNNSDVLFIPLGHGGVVPGIVAYKHYVRLHTGDNSVLYPVRYSLDKKKDPNPQLTSEEIDYLKEAAAGRKVVIFDEDTFSGRTLFQASNFFRELLGREVIPLANLDLDHFRDLDRDRPRGSHLIGSTALQSKRGQYILLR